MAEVAGPRGTLLRGTFWRAGREEPVEARSCGRSIAYPPVSREASLPCIGPNGAFRYVSGPPLGGFSKPRPLAVVLYWTVEGVEPSSAGCKPTVFPVRRHAHQTSSGPAGSRTLNLDFKRVLLCQLSYKAIVQCVGQELNLHSSRGWVTATWVRQCPADTSFSTLDGI